MRWGWLSADIFQRWRVGRCDAHWHFTNEKINWFKWLESMQCVYVLLSVNDPSGIVGSYEWLSQLSDFFLICMRYIVVAAEFRELSPTLKYSIIRIWNLKSKAENQWMLKTVNIKLYIIITQYFFPSILWKEIKGNIFIAFIQCVFLGTS